MIITVDNSKEASTRSSLLFRQYHRRDNILSSSTMVANDYKIDEEEDGDDEPLEPEVTRITFLGHSDSPDKFGEFDSPEAFVAFFEAMREEPSNAKYLENLETIDLFSCQVGRRVDGKSFAGEVARILSEKGLPYRIRAFSHPETETYTRTLLLNEDSWSFLGLNTQENRRYLLNFKSKLKEIETDIIHAKDGIAEKREAVKELEAKISDIEAQQNTLDVPTVAGEESMQLLLLHQELTAKIALLENEVRELNELIGNCTELEGRYALGQTKLRNFLNTTTAIVAPTTTPRETLDQIAHCCFDSASIMQFQTTSSAGAGINPSAGEEKFGGSHTTGNAALQQRMREEMASGRHEEQEKKDSSNVTTSSTGLPSLGGSEEK